MTTSESDRSATARTAALAVLAGVVVAGVVLVGAVAGAILAGLLVAALVWVLRRDHGKVTLSAGELDRLRDAEMALGRAAGISEAATELGNHALELLGARSAVVLIEGIGDTVRVTVGDRGAEAVYGSGSRMRLLEDDGVPCGSIAVSGRVDGRAYTAKDERMLDALAERVSTTIHQVSLLTRVRAEQRKLDDLITSSSDGIFAVSPDLRVTSWNPAMEAITGVASADALRRHVTDSFAPHDGDGAPRWGSQDPGRSGRATGILLRLGPESEPTWVRCSYAPLSDGGYVVIARDESDRKRLQDDKDGWIAQVSHELRTPLTPLKGFLQTLSRRDATLDTAQRQKIYEVMLREQHRLETLVDGLLASTQLEEGTEAVATGAVDWRPIVLEQTETLATAHADRAVTARVPARVPPLDTEPALATTVLSNLLSNAVKYTPDGSPIEIEVAIDRSRGIVRTSVIDHGPGVPRADRERIFQRFTRLGDHLTRPQQGVGLGLHIARQAARQVGGSLECTETPGGGATFVFCQPVASARARRAAAVGMIDLSDGAESPDDEPEGEGSAARPRRRLRAPR